jgi:uncharacterized protein YyaL (SSP411 family)
VSRLRVGIALALGALALASVFWFHDPAPPPPTTLPGTTEATLSAGLRAELRDVERGPLRTRHLEADGTPTYTNRLVRSDSPYLRQHAHNPVNWFEWGDEAFTLAAELDRPIFLSVGYATCHWCHVMEEESFEDPEIAAFLNAHFIAVKVDREQRPDVDRIYMASVTAFHGRGGWPMSVWLKPDRAPFFAATYLPARDGDRGARKGFFTVLQELHDAWTTERDRIDGTASELTAIVRRNLTPPPESGVPGPEVAAELVRWSADRFDTEHGGRVGRPKFPSSLPVRALLGRIPRGDREAERMARASLDAMATGGIYDHIGGGFHRYTVDDAWRVPHFEKMLYDNAQLARLYGEAFQLTGDRLYARVAQETLEFALRDLAVAGGGFASALDADSEGWGARSGERAEGLYYTWTPDEVRASLGEQAAAFLTAYGLDSEAELDGRHVLHLVAPDARNDLTRARLTLQLARRERPAPLRDDKVLTGWNGLMIDALAYNGWLFAREDWLAEARAAATRLLEPLDDPRFLALARQHTDRGPSGTAFLDDYAFLIRGLITLFEATGEPHWLEAAIALEGQARERYADPEGGAWFRTPSDHEALLVREKDLEDRPLPASNTVMLDNLVRLHALTGDDIYRESADAIASGLPIAATPAAFPNAVLALEGRHTPLEEVVLVKQPDQVASGMKAALRRIPTHWRVLIQTDGTDPAVGAIAPPAAGKTAIDGQPTAYVCRGGVCDQPTTDPETLAALLSRRASPSAPAR